MDGARLLNACIATGISARDMAAGWDSAWIDFSKGLGAPIGGVIAGSRAFIDDVWRWKQRLGGSMRQAGICAAACVYALDHHVDRLADDHANARALARGLSQINGIEVQQPETNLVFFEITKPGWTSARGALTRLRSPYLRSGILPFPLRADYISPSTHPPRRLSL